MNRSRENRAHWDRVLDPQNVAEKAQGPASLDAELRHWDSTEQRWAVRRLEPLAGRRALELGGGLGVGALALAKRGARVVLLDLSVERARAARRALDLAGVKAQVDVVVGAAEQLPFREGVFDRATTKSVLIHTDLSRAAREVHRALREGGRAVVLEPLEGHPAIQAYRAFLAPKAWKAITRYWNPKRVATFAEPFGGLPAARLRFFHFTGVVSAFFTYGPLRCRFLRRFCEGVFDQVDGVLLRVVPGLRWRCWFAGVEVKRGSRRRESP